MRVGRLLNTTRCKGSWAEKGWEALIDVHRLTERDVCLWLTFEWFFKQCYTTTLLFLEPCLFNSRSTRRIIQCQMHERKAWVSVLPHFYGKKYHATLSDKHCRSMSPTQTCSSQVPSQTCSSKVASHFPSSQVAGHFSSSQIRCKQRESATRFRLESKTETRVNISKF